MAQATQVQHATLASANLHISGMTCAACVSTVTNALVSVDGVESAEVSLATNTANIEYLPSRTNLAAISDAVSNAGYRVDGGGSITAEDGADGRDARVDAQRAEMEQIRLKAFVGIAVAAFIIVATAVRSTELLDQVSTTAFNLVFLLLATPIQFWGAAQFYRSAWSAARRKTSNMNTLVVIGTSVAYGYSAVVTIAQMVSEDLSIGSGSASFISAGHATGTYFEVSVAIIGLVLFGRWLEARTRVISSEAVRGLIRLQPLTALVERDGSVVEMGISDIKSGHTVVLRPGERVAVDGIVAEGAAEIDESMLTGESGAVEKSRGESVFAGTVNIAGSLKIVAQKVGSDTLLSQIIRQVERAQASRAPIERLVDRVAARFVPAVLVIAFVAFLIWWMLAPEPGFTNAMLVAVTVLVISCPCALGLATPTAIVAGIGKAAQLGILIRNASAIEEMAGIDTVVFDKTGTLTEGRPKVADVFVDEDSGVDVETLLGMAAAAESGSEHPIGEAIRREAEARKIAVPRSTNFRYIAGQGVFAEVSARTVSVVKSSGIDAGRHSRLFDALRGMEESAQTVVAVTVEGEPVGVIGLTDGIRAEARDAVEKLHEMEIETHLLTGDREKPARKVANVVGIGSVSAEVLPSDKAKTVGRLNRQGRKTAMVGDGINDAPALATANVGVAMGGGTDIAIETAQVTVMNNDLEAVSRVVRLSRATAGVIRQNLFWAFIYNTALIPIAAGVLYPFFADGGAPSELRFIIGENGFLNPVAAAAAMALSSLSVSFNSLRLRRFR